MLKSLALLSGLAALSAAAPFSGRHHDTTKSAAEADWETCLLFVFPVSIPCPKGTHDLLWSDGQNKKCCKDASAILQDLTSAPGELCLPIYFPHDVTCPEGTHDEDLGGGSKTCCVDNSGPQPRQAASVAEICLPQFLHVDVRCPLGFADKDLGDNLKQCCWTGSMGNAAVKAEEFCLRDPYPKGSPCPQGFHDIEFFGDLKICCADNSAASTMQVASSSKEICMLTPNWGPNGTPCPQGFHEKHSYGNLKMCCPDNSAASTMQAVASTAEEICLRIFLPVETPCPENFKDKLLDEHGLFKTCCRDSDDFYTTSKGVASAPGEICLRIVLPNEAPCPQGTHDEDIGGGLKTCCLDNPGAFTMQFASSTKDICLGNLILPSYVPCPAAYPNDKDLGRGRKTCCKPESTTAVASAPGEICLRIVLPNEAPCPQGTHDEDIGGGLKTCCLDNSGTYATHVSPSDDEACVGKLFRKDEPCPEGTHDKAIGLGHKVCCYDDQETSATHDASTKLPQALQAASDICLMVCWPKDGVSCPSGWSAKVFGECGTCCKDIPDHGPFHDPATSTKMISHNAQQSLQALLPQGCLPICQPWDEIRCPGEFLRRELTRDCSTCCVPEANNSARSNDADRSPMKAEKDDDVHSLACFRRCDYEAPEKLTCPLGYKTQSLRLGCIVCCSDGTTSTSSAKTLADL